MSTTSAQLLAAAILDNTLNFTAGVTTPRDKAAYAFLATHARLDDSWAASYFTECQQSVLADLSDALRKDTKYFKRDGLDKELTMGQVALWDAHSVITTDLAVFRDSLRKSDKVWLVNVISISEGKSYFIRENPEMHE